ncbi:hypothetical protein [Salinarchaeum chitinilyticum]
MKQYYRRVDRWIRGLSRGAHALLLGICAVVGVLVAGLVVSAELLVLQALTTGLVIGGLQYVFGQW